MEDIPSQSHGRVAIFPPTRSSRMTGSEFYYNTAAFLVEPCYVEFLFTSGSRGQLLQEPGPFFSSHDVPIFFLFLMVQPGVVNAKRAS